MKPFRLFLTINSTARACMVSFRIYHNVHKKNTSDIPFATIVQLQNHLFHFKIYQQNLELCNVLLLFLRFPSAVFFLVYKWLTLHYICRWIYSSSYTNTIVCKWVHLDCQCLGNIDDVQHVLAIFHTFMQVIVIQCNGVSHFKTNKAEHTNSLKLVTLPRNTIVFY